MKAKLFACDIDNTLIYSRRRPHEGFRCVEWIQGEEQAYMSPGTIALLRRRPAEMLFVPVTSRSIAQYGRIRFPDGCAPEWAVVANGAVLLHRREMDGDWAQRTGEILSPWRRELTRMHALLCADERFARCRIVDEAYVFIQCDDGVAAQAAAEALSEETELDVIAAGRKIYLLPPGIDKACAVQRLRERFDCGDLICAGDSNMDLPMLRIADCAIMPKALREKWRGHGQCIAWNSDVLFSEFALSRGLDWMNRS